MANNLISESHRSQYYKDALFGVSYTYAQSGQIPGYFMKITSSQIGDQSSSTIKKGTRSYDNVVYLYEHDKKYFPYANEFSSGYEYGTMIKAVLERNENISGLSEDELGLGEAVLQKLSGLRAKWPVSFDKKGTGDGEYFLPKNFLQDLSENNALESNSDYLNLLRLIWKTRLNEYKDFMHVTNTSKTVGTADQTGESHTGVNTKSHAEGTTEGESHTGVNTTSHTEGTTQGESHTDVNTKSNTKSTTDGTSHSKTDTTSDGTNDTDTTGSSTTDGTNGNKSTSHSAGTSDTDTTGKSTTDGTDKSLTVNGDFPEANVGIGTVTPGAVSYKYASGSSETSKNTHSGTDTTGSSKNKTSADGNTTSDTTTHSETDTTGSSKNKTHATGSSTTDGTTHQDGTGESTGTSQTDGTTKGSSTSDGTGSSQTDGTTRGSSTTDGTGSSQTDGTTKGNQQTETSTAGRSIDLITLSDKFQSVAEAKKTLVDALVDTLKPCFQAYTGSFSSDYLWGYSDDDIFYKEGY